MTRGVGFNVYLCETKGAVLAGGDFICGAAPIPPELRARDVPRGQGNIRPAAALGGGVDFLLTHKIFVGAEVRHNIVSGSPVAEGLRVTEAHPFSWSGVGDHRHARL